MMSLNVESEMEEGEIIDELDDLSDISSEEEFTWLRERAAILESYNNVLGRNKAKLYQNAGTKLVQLNNVWQELPVIDVTINNKRRKHNVSETTHMHMNRNFNQPKYDKRSHINLHEREWMKSRHSTKHITKPNKRVSESSEYSENEEIENKKIKLANAVTIQKNKIDKTTLKERLMKMTLSSNANLKKQRKQNNNVYNTYKTTIKKEKVSDDKGNLEFKNSNIDKINNTPNTIKAVLCNSSVKNKGMFPEKVLNELDVHSNIIKYSSEFSDSGIDKNKSKSVESQENTKKQVPKEKCLNRPEFQSNIKICSDFSDSSVDYKNISTHKESESHENCENNKESNEENTEDPNFNGIYITKFTPKTPPTFEVKDSDDDNSDTQELRLICLKSSALKKAIEKQKQKKKQLKKTASVALKTSKTADEEVFNNNTDVDSVDMDMSDNDVIADKNPNHDSMSEDYMRKSARDDDLDLLRLELLLSIETDSKKIEERKKLIMDIKDRRAAKETTVEKTVKNPADSKSMKSILEKPAIKQGSNRDNPKKEEIRTEISVQNVNNKLKKMDVGLPKTEKKDTNKICIRPVEQEKNIKKSTEVKKHVGIDIKKPVVENVKKVNLEKEKDNSCKNVDLIIIANDSDSETEATKNLTKMHNKLAPATVGTEFQKRLDFLLKSTRSMVEKEISVKKTNKPEKPFEEQKFVPKAVEHLPKSAQKEYNDLVKRMADLERKMKAREAAKALRFQESLKDRKVNIDNNPTGLEEQIRISRKNIAQESTHLLKLKEEGKKMVKRQEILSIELLNLSTAIANNKKQTRFSQIKFNNFRTYHQALLKKVKQFEKRDPYKKQNIHDSKTAIIKKVVSSNNYVINKPRIKTDNAKEVVHEENKVDSRVKYAKVCKGPNIEEKSTLKSDKVDDYKSPLQAISKEAWTGDPNGVLCPFDVQGVCKDTNCKYIHSRLFTPSSR